MNDPTTVRVPLFYGHSAAIHLETRDRSQQAMDLKTASGIALMDDQHYYPPPPAHDTASLDSESVGHIREDYFILID